MNTNTYLILSGFFQGMRFALIQLKTAIAVMISNFQFSPCAKTPIPIVYDDHAAGLKPKGGLWLNVASRG